jgi:hypothetical protein
MYKIFVCKKVVSVPAIRLQQLKNSGIKYKHFMEV